MENRLEGVIGVGHWITITDDDGKVASGRVVRLDENGDFVIDTAAEMTPEEKAKVPEGGFMRLLCYRCRFEFIFNEISEQIAVLRAEECGWKFLEDDRVMCPKCSGWKPRRVSQ